VVALRIGYFSPNRPTAEAVSPTDRSAWLSPRDAAELVRAAVEADGVDFVVADGVSANRYPKADVSRTVARMGYQPLDDAWDEETGRRIRRDGPSLVTKESGCPTAPSRVQLTPSCC
jgi:uronate dehydrogenase